MEHPLSMILASGEASSTGQLFETTNPLLRTVISGILEEQFVHILSHGPHTLKKRALDALLILQRSHDFFAF